MTMGTLYNPRDGQKGTEGENFFQKYFGELVHHFTFQMESAAEERHQGKDHRGTIIRPNRKIKSGDVEVKTHYGPGFLQYGNIAFEMVDEKLSPFGDIIRNPGWLYKHLFPEPPTKKPGANGQELYGSSKPMMLANIYSHSRTNFQPYVAIVFEDYDALANQLALLYHKLYKRDLFNKDAWPSSIAEWSKICGNKKWGGLWNVDMSQLIDLATVTLINDPPDPHEDSYQIFNLRRLCKAAGNRHLDTAQTDAEIAKYAEHGVPVHSIDINWLTEHLGPKPEYKKEAEPPAQMKKE